MKNLNYRPLLSSLAFILFSGLVQMNSVRSQDQDAVAYRETLRDRSLRREAEAFSEAFRGITTDGTPISGLYNLKPTGISTRPLVDAANTFLETLDTNQSDEVMFAVDDIEWRKWANQSNYYRDGLWFENMNDRQRMAAFGMMGASLSDNGMQTARDIMKLNGTLAELNNNDYAAYGEWKYWLSVMGEPSETEPWGWQLDGHHLVINYVVIGDRVVMTPVFWGSEPAVATGGRFEGTQILVEETAAGLQMIRSLDLDQRGKAVLEVNKTENNLITQAFTDNVIVPNAGIQGNELTDGQKQFLLDLIGLYIGKMREEHADVRMDEIENYIDETWFAWIGGSEDDSVFYYRIQSPVLLIEFDHQRPVGLRHIYTHNQPYREHIHSVVRSPNGNDYGRDLLRQHYETHAHGDLDEHGVAQWHDKRDSGPAQ